MPDMGKIINELNDCLENQHIAFIDGVGDVYAVSEETIKNIITILKEQESIIESLKSDLHETLEVVSGRLNVVRCKNCKECYFASNRIQSEQTFACGKHGIDVTPDWFCADGERK